MSIKNIHLTTSKNTFDLRANDIISDGNMQIQGMVTVLDTLDTTQFLPSLVAPRIQCVDLDAQNITGVI